LICNTILLFLNYPKSNLNISFVNYLEASSFIIVGLTFTISIFKTHENTDLNTSIETIGMIIVFFLIVSSILSLTYELSIAKTLEDEALSKAFQGGTLFSGIYGIFCIFIVALYAKPSRRDIRSKRRWDLWNKKPRR
jgi:hypothetical protein